MATIYQLIKAWMDTTGVDKANLYGADLYGANLCEADLKEANLRGAYLSGADLSGACLKEANLRGAYLSGADLYGANLCEADLSGACLKGANLCGAYLKEANLSGADLSEAYLSGANLSGANLSGTDLSGAYLSNTCLDTSASVPAITDAEIVAAGFTIDGDKVYGYRTAQSRHCGNTKYVVREEPYIPPYFSIDNGTSCHPGIYLASKSWLEKEYPYDGYVRCYCLRTELVGAGDKWRCKRLWIVE